MSAHVVNLTHVAESDRSASKLTLANTFVIAVWAAIIGGLLEGIVQCISRAYPAIYAAHKVSPDVLWVSPALDLLLFFCAATCLYLVRSLIQRWSGVSDLLIAYRFFAFFGVFPLLIAPGIIHPVAAFVLSLGIAKLCWDKFRGNEHQIIMFLRRRLPWIVVGLLLIVLGVATYEKLWESWLYRQLPTPLTRQANVLLIVMDTVRYDSFARSAHASLTPNLNHFGMRGIRFENAWSTSSWSLASQASILTGRYPYEHGADWPNFKRDRRYASLAEFFASKGYVTGAFSGNSAWITPEYVGQGFLRFEVYILEDLLRRTVYGRIIGLGLRKVGYHEAGRGKKADTVNRQFFKFISDYPDRPFFAYLCYMDVNQYFHNRWFNSRFLAEAPMREVFEAYTNGLKVLDTKIADLFNGLNRMGILDDTLVVITSDHGQSFGATETKDHDPLGHGTSLYPEQIKVPLILVFPTKIRAGQTVVHDVSTRAIAATIVRLLGFADSPFDGVSLVSAGQEHNSEEESAGSVFASLNYDNHPMKTLIKNHWQYIKNFYGNRKDQEELYNLSSDPLAQQNLAPHHPQVSKLRDLMDQQFDSGMHGQRLVAAEPASK